MRPILSYSPEIHVEAPDGTVCAISLQLPDFETDETVLQQLAQTTQAHTVGELVNALSNEEIVTHGAPVRVQKLDVLPETVEARKIWSCDTVLQ